MDTAHDLGTPGEDNTYGWGFVDAYEAVLAVMQGYGHVEGIVTDAGTGQPIAGVTVAVAGRRTPPTTARRRALPLRAAAGHVHPHRLRAFGYCHGSQSVT